MKTIVAILLVVSAWQVQAQTEVLRQKHFNLKGNLAIEGYDPVSFFAGEPQKGKAELKLTHNGVTYQFASQANLNKFKANPEAYEPAYGGWCAYAMGDSGKKV